MAVSIFARLAETIRERILYFLCRYCAEWRGAWRFRLAERVVAFRFASSGNFVTTTRFGFPIEVRKNDGIGHALHFYGCLNPQLESVIEAEVKPGDCALDLGANIGGITLLLAQLVGPKGRVFAVEPMSANAELLTSNVHRSGSSSIVTIEHRAAGRAPEHRKLFFDAATRNWGAISLHDQSGSGAEDIEIEPLDAMWNRWGRPQLALVKMDVEGFEMDVVAGAQELLAVAPPRVWVVEFNPDHGAQQAGLWEAFTSRGYAAFSKENLPLREAPQTHCDVVFRLRAS